MVFGSDMIVYVCMCMSAVVGIMRGEHVQS